MEYQVSFYESHLYPFWKSGKSGICTICHFFNCVNIDNVTNALYIKVTKLFAKLGMDIVIPQAVIEELG